jgi:BioD-like phosphotransacetylase family protein
MGILYVAGERPGAGATAIAAALATLWRRAGRRVAVAKPAALDDDSADGAMFGRRFASSPDSAPIVIAAGEPDGDALDAAAQRVSGLSEAWDTVIVEGLPLTGPDGNAIPASPALVERLGAKVLGVVPYHRSLDSMTAAIWRDTFGSSLAGVIINRRTRYGVHDASTRLTPAFEDAGVSVLGVLPVERLLLAPTMRQVSELLDGTFFAGASGEDRLIEHFLVGGLITEWGGDYFNRLPNQAVIVRGGRMDIQMSALNFPLTCLLLTGCEQPPQYVYQRAQDLDVPLVTVARNTEQTAAALEQLRVTCDHDDKLERLATMIEESLDLTVVSAAVGVGAG